MATGSIIPIENRLLDLATKGENRQEREDHGEDERGVELASRIPAKAFEVEREHGLVIVEGVTKVIRPEQHPADHDQEERDQRGKREMEFFPFST